MARRTRIAASVLLVLIVGAAVPAIARLASRQAAAGDPVLEVMPATPAFTLTHMVPGDSMTRCVAAANTGGSAMKLFDYPTLVGELAPYLLVTVERGTGVGPEAPSCANFSRSTANPYAYNTEAGGVPVSQLQPELDSSFAAGENKSLRVTIAMPSETTAVAAAKNATLGFTFAGQGSATSTTPTSTSTDGTPHLPGGIAPGTTGGFDKNGNFLTNKQIKKRLRIGKARMLRNGNIVVMMYLPAGGAIRAKAILPNGVYYAHTLLPEEWGPKLRVLLVRRPVGRAAVARAKRTHRRLTLKITTRYRWAHGPDAYVQPEQKLIAVRGRR